MDYIKKKLTSIMIGPFILLNSFSLLGQEKSKTSVQELNHGACWVKSPIKTSYFKGASFFKERTYDLSPYKFSQFYEEIENQISQYNLTLSGSGFSTFVHCSSDLALLGRFQLKDGINFCAWGKWNQEGRPSLLKLTSVSLSDKKNSPCFGFESGKVFISFLEEDRDKILETLENENEEIIIDLELNERTGALYFYDEYRFREEEGKKKLEKLLSSHGVEDFSLYFNHHYQLNGEFFQLPNFSRAPKKNFFRNSEFR